MRQIQPISAPKRTPVRFYAFTAFIGGLIRNTSFLMLVLCFSFAAAAIAVSTAKSLWNDPGVRSFVAALEADLAEWGASAADLDAPPQRPVRDPEKAQKEENRARRKLAEELRQRKSSARGMKAAQ